MRCFRYDQAVPSHAMPCVQQEVRLVYAHVYMRVCVCPYCIGAQLVVVCAISSIICLRGQEQKTRRLTATRGRTTDERAYGPAWHAIHACMHACACMKPGSGHHARIARKVVKNGRRNGSDERSRRPAVEGQGARLLWRILAASRALVDPLIGRD